MRLRRQSTPSRSLAQPSPHRVLRVSRHETDPVMIILAAQLQLRRWRLADPAKQCPRIRQRIQAIVVARDLLVGRTLVLKRPQRF
jgi:hypothetical protein